MGLDVLLAEGMSVLQLGGTLVLQTGQNLLQALLLLVLTDPLVHRCDQLSDQNQGAGHLSVLNSALYRRKERTRERERQ